MKKNIKYPSLDKVRVELTSTSFWKAESHKDLVAECQEVCNDANIDFGVQIHNMASEKEVEDLLKLQVPLSFHAPNLSKYQMNLASDSFEYALDSFEKTVKLIRDIKKRNTPYNDDYNIAVFHGFNMTDLPIECFTDVESFYRVMQNSYREEYSLPNTTVCTDFFNTDEFIMRQQRVVERQHILIEKYPDIEFVIENDLPIYSAGNLLAKCFKNYPMNFCLDSSHLWFSAFLYGKDFIEETEKFLKTNQVKMVHLHASKYTKNNPIKEWSDGHLPLTTDCEMPVKEFAIKCLKYGVKHFVLEVRHGRKSDIMQFVKYLREYEKYQ
ncbi:hypothetical protein AAEX28_03685 [Lentisphaerota bacterium WC36G]|nr:hypothetical protein LJT99_06560 [Lentisphaerae bacterium WC36]